MNELINNEDYGINVDFEAEYFADLFENAQEKWAARVVKVSAYPHQDFTVRGYLEYVIDWLVELIGKWYQKPGQPKAVVEGYRIELSVLGEMLAKC